MDVITFAAGPGKLPREVLQNVQHELLNFKNLGISVMELSHRSPEYAEINNNAQSMLRKLLDIPDNYKILFMQGGGTALFSAIPLNLMGRTGTADYVVTGTWSKQAAREAEKYGKVNYVLTEPIEGIPDEATWNLNPKASFVYYCSNETISGTEFNFIPDTKGVPLVADMSSNFLSRPFDVTKFGLVFASAQKNIGPAGIVVVIVREDLIGSPLPLCPVLYDFAVINKANSIYNTPPTFVVYFIGEVFKWIDSNGGVKGMEKNAIDKSSLLYSIIDQSKGFYNSVHQDKNVRSRMNVVFRLNDSTLEQKFLAEGKKLGMIDMKGHRSIGGLRISLYNAVSIEDTMRVAEFMKSFEFASINS